MFGSTIVDIAVGLFFFYFLFSVITSHINELIAAMMMWRANDLEAQIRHMLGDPNLANKVLQNPVITTIASKGEKPAYIPPNTFALALFDAFVPEGQSPNVFDHVRAGVADNLPTNQATAAVLKILDRANGDIRQARAGAEEWFNESMDLLSAAYRRRMQWVSFFVALVLTSVLGADTLAIADVLYKEPALRAAITGAAQAAPSNASVQGTQGTPPGSGSSLQQSVDLVSKSGLPFGWGTLPNDPIGWFKKVLGLLITGLAISLGAPFWFSLLKEISNFRGGGSAPASTTSAAASAPAPTTAASVTPPSLP